MLKIIKYTIEYRYIEPRRPEKMFVISGGLINCEHLYYVRVQSCFKIFISISKILKIIFDLDIFEPRLDDGILFTHILPAHADTKILRRNLSHRLIKKHTCAWTRIWIQIISRCLRIRRIYPDTDTEIRVHAQV